MRGRCHCGNLTFSLEWGPTEIPARACTCSFCVRHGNVWASHPDARLEVFIAEPSAVHEYAFGTETARFHVCGRCGVVPLATSQIDGGLYAVVNVNTLEGVAPSRLRHSTTTLDDEALETRLARRKRNWIGSVVFPRP